MDKNLTRYIWRITRKQQIFVLAIVLLSMVPYYLAFDLPKQIVNGPIQGHGFAAPGVTQPFMPISLSLPWLGSVRIFEGIDLGRTATLFGLSFVFLGLVIVNGLFKLYINTYKGKLGERLLRRIRYDLVDRVLRFPPSVFKRMKAAEIASMIKDEVEPLGGFSGDAFVSPLLLGGQALTALIFIMMQNFWLGLIAAGMVGIQAFIIPRMRRRLLVLGRERQLTARELAGRISEIIDGIGTIHAYDTSNYERADIASRLGRIFKIRYDLYEWKFMVKFLNNFLAQVTPFLFYSIGGYLALTGRLDIGQLVAVIGAYKDLPAPLKDLIDWDQARQDVQVKYNQVVEQFNIDQTITSEIQALSSETAPPLGAPLAATGLTLADDSGARLLERATLQIVPGERVAVLGTAASGGEALVQAFARLIWPEAGRITIGGRDIHTMPESIIGRRLTYASSEAYFFSGTISDNLFYSLKHAPMIEGTYSAAEAQEREWAIAEAARAGNPDFDTRSDWIDYAGAGVADRDALFASASNVLDIVQLSPDLIDLALRSSVERDRHSELTSRIVEMRHALRERLQREGLSSLVAPFEPDAYNVEATVGENLLFGVATGHDLKGKRIASNTYFRSVVDATGLEEQFYQMGLEIAENTVELFSDLPVDHPFFQQLTFMTPEDLPSYQALLQRVRGRPRAEVSREDWGAVARLSFFYIEPRHRFGLLTPELMDSIVQARHQFYAGLPDTLSGQIERYDPLRYTHAASLLDNVLFGRISHRYADNSDRIRTIVRDLFSEIGLKDRVLAIGLDYHAGVGGKRLTDVQRQKLNLARALLRSSDFYVLNRPLPALDARMQERVLKGSLDYLRERQPGAAIICVLSNAGLINQFDRALVFDKGMLVEEGPPDGLAEKDGLFRQLVA